MNKLPSKNEAESIQISSQSADDIFCALIENAFDIIIILDVDGVIRYANPTLERVLGHKPADLIDKALTTLIHPEDAAATVHRFIDKVKSHSPDNESHPILIETRLLHQNGSWHIFESILKPLDVSSTKGIVINSRDITERKKMDALRIGQAEILEMIATGAPLENVLESLLYIVESQSIDLLGSILLLDNDGRLVRRAVSIRLPEIASYLNTLEGTPISPEIGICCLAIQRREMVVVQDILSDPFWSDHRDWARQYQLHACMALPIFSPKGNVLGAFSLYFREAREPTFAELRLLELATHIAGIAIERRQTGEQIEYMAHHDALTRLPNRLLLQDRLDVAIQLANRTGQMAALLFIDLDHFKHVNDSLGHLVGDRLLQAVAIRLHDCLRKGDSLARLGGDEFVVLLSSLAHSKCVALVAQKIIDSLHQPFTLDEHTLHVSCSIGISLYPGDGDCSEVLMRAADTAMYHAKQNGRHNYQFFTLGLNAAAQYRHSITAQLRQALDANEFKLEYQCQVDMASGKIFAMEALIRWQQPERGLVSPIDFISIAEETGLILPIGEWALRTACEQLKCWHDAGHADLSISVNLSVRQVLQYDIVNVVARVLQETGLPAASLDLEITESILLPHFEECLAKLTLLGNMGIHLSMDDFGTGYSNLSYLQRFPIHTLKIDQSFVCAIGHDPNYTAIVNAIISMGNSMNLKVIAEGVETAEQAAYLCAHGCMAGQGYYFSKPIPAAAMTDLLGKQTIFPTAFSKNTQP